MQVLAVVAVAMMAAACGRNTTAPTDGAGIPQEIGVGDTVRLRVGGTATVRGTGVSIVFHSLVSDSRCPIDAICVWEGDAEVRVDVRQNSSDWQPFRLHTTLEPKSVPVDDYSIRLLEVAPARVSTDSVRPGDYSVRLEVVRR